MNEQNKFSISPKHLLIFFIILSAILMIISFFKPTAFAPVQNGVSVVVAPMQKGINVIGEWFSDKADLVREIRDLKSENTRLKSQIDELTAENAFTSQMVLELDELRELLKLDDAYKEYPKVAARVISANAGNWFTEFIIDKGEKDGMQVDMNVIADGGLVGRITYVGNNYSKVSTIISDGHNVSAKLAATPDNCIVSGDLTLNDKNLLRVSNMDIKATINDGDQLVTSYISDKYVPGLLIGYVSDFTNDANNITQSGYLTPAVDFKNIDIVLVITTMKVSGEDD